MILPNQIFNYSFHCCRRELLKESAPHLVQSVCAYRAGYTAEVYEMHSIVETRQFCNLYICMFELWNGNQGGRNFAFVLLQNKNANRVLPLKKLGALVGIISSQRIIMKEFR